MSSIKEKFAAIKKALFDIAPAAPAAKAYKLQDGTDITISALEMGGDVILGGVPAKAGEYILNDGASFSVGADGKISTVKAATPPVETPPAIVPGAPITDNLMDGTVVSYDNCAVGGIIKGVDGQPLAAGIYTLDDGTSLTVGDGGVISAATPGNVPDYDEAMKTEAGRAAFVKTFIQKFDDTTGTGDIANLKTCVKALLNYSFGWDIRQAEENAQKQAAITILKTGFEKQIADQKLVIENQGKALKLMFEAVQEMGGELTAEPPEEVKQKFVTSKVKQKGDYKNAMLKAIAEAVQ